jgi:hypothetical protein
LFSTTFKSLIIGQTFFQETVIYDLSQQFVTIL